MSAFSEEIEGTGDVTCRDGQCVARVGDADERMPSAMLSGQTGR